MSWRVFSLLSHNSNGRRKCCWHVLAKITDDSLFFGALPPGKREINDHHESCELFAFQNINLNMHAQDSEANALLPPILRPI